MVSPCLPVLGLLLFIFEVSGQTLPNYEVTTVVNAPHVMQKANGVGFEGIIIDILQELSKRANFTYTIRLVRDGSYGSPDRGGNGTWNGMIGEILRNEAHIAAAPLTIMPQRAAVVRFTQPYVDAGLKILYKRPTDWMNSEPLFILLSVFSPGLWIVVLLLVAAITALLHVIARFSPLEDASLGEKKRENAGLTILNSFLYTFSVLGWQNYTPSPRSISGRILMAFWWLFSLFILVAFTANLTAFFITQEPNVSRVPFSTFSELVRQKNIRYGTFKYGSTEMFFRTTRSHLAKRMWATMNAQNTLMRTLDQGVQKVRAGKFAFIVEGPLAEYMAGKTPCDLTVVGESLNDRGYAFACSNKSTLCGILDQKILELKEEDFIINTTNKWASRGCNVDKGRELVYDGVPFFDSFGRKSGLLKDKSVTLKRFASGFIFLFLGIFLAGLCLIGEIVYAKKSGYSVNVLPSLRTSDQERIQDSFDSGR
ncbi:glutamate receptor 4-like [Haliotis rufescens]|uniref:glutamate receptor 4-like n=1 Tax=Haliotis rufescens TaxID=6454 RepID=UPI001EB066F7|nr:glutamate receptor 4-like [Haliotis rufescens]